MSEPGYVAGVEPAVDAPAPVSVDAPTGAPVLAALAGPGAAMLGRLAGRPPEERAAALGRGGGNAAVSRMLLRQPTPSVGSPAAADAATSSETWQHEAVRPRAEAIERAKKEKEKPKDRGAELYMEVVPAVVRAVKGYSTADGKQIPLENALLIIAQGTAEHSPYNPETLNKPVVPAGNMLWGVTSDSKTPGSTVKTRTDEVKDGQRRSESNRSFRAYDSMDEAAIGYLRALEGSDPDAAKNPNYQNVLNVLTKPGATPAEFGEALQNAHYATDPNYGEHVAANAGTGGRATAARLIPKFMPQIKAGQQAKIDALREKQVAYSDLITWIEARATDVRAELEERSDSSEESTKLEEELAQLEADRNTAMEAIEKMEPQIAKEQQLLTDLDEFAATLPEAPAP
jgi:hypothetical protein